MKIEDDVKAGDYNLNHPDILAAKKVEQYYYLFEIFKIQDPRTISLVLAGARTIANRLGTFSNADLEHYLGYMKKTNRIRVVNYLKKHGWIVHNGIDYEMPSHVRSFLVFLFSSFVRGNMSIAEQIRAISAEADMAENYNIGEEAEATYYMGMKALVHWRDYMKRVLQKRSRREIAEIFQGSKDISDAIRSLQKGLKKKKDNLFSSLSKQQEIHELASEILELLAGVLNVALDSIRGDAKSIGEYITPTMVEEFLHNAPLDFLAQLSVKNFASPKQVLQLREETVASKAMAFFARRPEIDPNVPPPPVVNFVEEEIITERLQNPLELLYQELTVKMEGRQEAPFEEMLFKEEDGFGMAMYRTGQMVKLSIELQSPDISTGKTDAFRIQVYETFKELPKGPVAEMSDTVIRKEGLSGK